MPVSDRHGRAYEYRVAKAAFSRLRGMYPGKAVMTPRARSEQRRGKEQFESLGEGLRNQFESSASKVAEWLANNKLRDVESMEFERSGGLLTGFYDGETGSEEISRVELDRIPDMAGVRGDVTDIRIRFFSKGGVASVNISLKHRHEALKHPRLTRVPEWVGLANTREAKKYREGYESIWDSFFKRSKALSPGAKRFRELKAIDSGFIEDKLYKPLYALVANFLEQNIKSPTQVQQMFDFMVGKFDYIKFVEHDGKIEVRDFSGIPKPNSVKIEYTGTGYLHLHFDNGWVISGRLHTATQWLDKSIKFDMQPCNLDSVVPAVYI